MRVLIINTSERTGGAAIAASRLMESLKNNGIKAKMLVRDKQTDQISVVGLKRSWKLVWHFLWERMVIWAANRFKRNNLFAVDIANCGTDITSLPEFRQADVIHLHYVNQGMLSLKGIRKIFDSGKPVVWTMHDMWPCTGICHHARDCGRYRDGCHHCPYLYGGGGRRDLSWRTYRRKRALYRGVPVTFVACSRWLEGRARESGLLAGKTVTAIPNPINTNLFRPRSKAEARARRLLPQDKRLLLFGAAKATDKRKGADFFVEACRILAEAHPEWRDTLGVAAFGSGSAALEGMLPFPVYVQDYVANEKDVVDLYNAVDVFVLPSLEENLPNMVMEAMACGVPCVAFQTGGVPEMVDHLHNGYVARYRDAADLANGIHWVLGEGGYQGLSEQACRKAVSSYSENIVAKRYIDVYNRITGSHG